MQTNKAGSSNGYPAGAVAVAGGDNQANAALTGTLAAAAGKTTYVAGIWVGGSGATAAGAIAVQLQNIVGGTRAFTFAVPAGIAQAGPWLIPFNPPIPASAVNTAINLTVAAFGAGSGGQSCMIWGYQL